MSSRKIRLAIIVTHPIQYFVPLYRSLARRDDIEIKVFFTLHAAEAPVQDRGFGAPIQWDIPLTSGYEFERVANVASDPGLHHFFGLNNPSLVKRVAAWKPDAVHITGWPWFSHFQALRAFGRRRIPVLFRGDSHLLDRPAGWRWLIKRLVLRWLYSNVSAFLVVGSANRRYYEAFAVPAERLFPCPHSIEVERFAEPADALEREARGWRDQLGISSESLVLLFAGKFERKKRPVELMRAVQGLGRSDVRLVMVGGGELEPQIKSLAAADPDRFRVLPFQNQTRMPVVYRLGDIFVLPSAYGETWGLAVNEAMASMRPVLVSDRVGCAADLVDESCGWVFSSDEPGSLARTLHALSSKRDALSSMGKAASRRSKTADIRCTEAAMLACLNQVIV